MIYPEIAFATFIERPNRFIARVLIDGDSTETVVHVKNTGRCRELLIPGCRVVLAKGQNPLRKTPYDLIAVWKVTEAHPEGWLFNIDSQAPNTVVAEWLASAPAGTFSLIKPEFTFGKSRVDFYLERPTTHKAHLKEIPSNPQTMTSSSGLKAATHPKASTAALPKVASQPAAQSGGDTPERILLEVKGCTLEIDGTGYFPDAPTERGTKHLRELTAAARDGYICFVAFVIQMEGVEEVLPHRSTDPAFGAALDEAQAAGVRVLNLTCAVEPDKLTITSPISLIY